MNRRVDYLDGVRGFAILLVVLAHIFPSKLGIAGPLGVLVFFVLSGYLITTLLVAEVERTGRINLRRFFARRALRLLPALLVTVALYLLVVLVSGDPDAIRPALLGAALGLVYLMDIARGLYTEVPLTLGPLWTLSVEEHFYLLWPVVVVLGLRRWGHERFRGFIRGALVLSVPAGLAFAVLQGLVPPLNLYYLPTTWVGTLLGGAYLAVSASSWRGGPRSSRPVWSTPTVAGVVLSALLAFIVIAQIKIDWFVSLVAVPVLCLGVTALLGYVILTPGAWARRLLEHRSVVSLGRLSYGVYLLNIPLITLTTQVLGDTPLTRPVGGVAAVLAAGLMHRFVERPALGLKDRWSVARSDALLLAPASESGPADVLRIVR